MCANSGVRSTNLLKELLDAILFGVNRLYYSSICKEHTMLDYCRVQIDCAKVAHSSTEINKVRNRSNK